MRGLKSFNDFIDRPAIVISNVLVLLCCLFVCAEVFARYVLGASQAFLEEYAKYYMVWFVYLLLGVVSRERGHVKIDVISRLLKGKSADIADIIFHFSVVVFCVIVGAGMVNSIHIHFLSGETLPIDFAIPAWAIRLVLPVGLLFLMLRNIQLVIDGILALRKERASAA